MSGSYQQVAATSVFGPDGKLLITSCAYPARHHHRRARGLQRHAQRTVDRTGLARDDGPRGGRSGVQHGGHTARVKRQIRRHRVDRLAAGVLQRVLSRTLGRRAERVARPHAHRRRSARVVSAASARPHDAIERFAAARRVSRGRAANGVRTRSATEDRRVPAGRQLSGLCVERLPDRHDLGRLVEASEI